MSQRVVTSLNWTTGILKKISIKIMKKKRKRDILVKGRIIIKGGHFGDGKKRTRENIEKREKKKAHWERKN